MWLHEQAMLRLFLFLHNDHIACLLHLVVVPTKREHVMSE